MVGEVDVGSELVRQGLAFNFDKQDTAYKAMEDEAKVAKAGLWADGVEFEKPWLFRAKNNAGTR